MDQLLQITNIPIRVEIQIQRAQLQHDTQQPRVNVSRNRGGLTMKADPIRINLDTTKVRESVGAKGPDTLTKEFGAKGIQVSYDAIAKIVQNGNKLMDGISQTRKFSPSDLAKQTNLNSIETVLDFIPKDSPDISWDGGTLSIQYKADDLAFDWNTEGTSFTFVPGNVELHVTQYPDVQIEYIGEPIYFPPSAMAKLGYGELNARA